MLALGTLCVAARGEAEHDDVSSEGACAAGAVAGGAAGLAGSGGSTTGAPPASAKALSKSEGHPAVVV
jgi:hypothetical protein